MEHHSGQGRYQHKHARKSRSPIAFITHNALQYR